MRAVKETTRQEGLGLPRLPRGVLLRVDVFRDADEIIQVYTRERLTPGSGEERSIVATLLLETGFDVLSGFKNEEDVPKKPPANPLRRSVDPSARISSSNSDYQRLYA